MEIHESAVFIRIRQAPSLLCAIVFAVAARPCDHRRKRAAGEAPTNRRSIRQSPTIQTVSLTMGYPKALAEVGIQQKLDEKLPLDAEFTDEEGETIRLGKYFGERPVVLALVYCGLFPML